MGELHRTDSLSGKHTQYSLSLDRFLLNTIGEILQKLQG